MSLGLSEAGTEFGAVGTGRMNKLWAPLRSPCTSARHRQTSTDSTHEGEKTGTRPRKSELFEVRFCAVPDCDGNANGNLDNWRISFHCRHRWPCFRSASPAAAWISTNAP